MLLVNKTRDPQTGTSKLQILRAFPDEDTISRFAAEAATGVSRDYREAKYIFSLNEWALRKARAPGFTGEMTISFGVAFMNALKRLKENPKTREKYGLAAASTRESVWDSAKDHALFAVVNKDYDEWDPGRFIMGVKPHALVPYELGGKLAERTSALEAYVTSFEERKRAQSRPKREASAIGPYQTLDEFLEPEVAEVAEVAEPEAPALVPEPA